MGIILLHTQHKRTSFKIMIYYVDVGVAKILTLFAVIRRIFINFDCPNSYSLEVVGVYTDRKSTQTDLI